MNACPKHIEELLTEPAAPRSETGRDSRGRFAAGNGGGPGNPFGRYTALLREALVAAVTEEDMQAIVHKMIAMAKAGSIPAMRMLLQYVIGKPTAAPNPDRVQMDEWNYFKDSAAMTDDVPRVVKSLEPEACLDMARELRPIMSGVAREKYVKEFDAPREKVSHPQPFSPEYRGEGSNAPAHDFDGGESKPAPVPQAHVPECRPESCAPSYFDGVDLNGAGESIPIPFTAASHADLQAS